MNYTIVVHLNIQASQGSAAKYLRRGGRFYSSFFSSQSTAVKELLHESRAVARKPRDTAVVLFGFKFTDNIHYQFKINQASKARLHNSKHTGAKQN